MTRPANRKRSQSEGRVIKIALDALEQTIWRDREQFPDDPFCYLCGAGRAWSKKYGHQQRCPMTRLAARRGGGGK